MPTSQPPCDGPPSASPSSHSDFDKLGLCPPLLAALRDLGYERTTPVQAQTIPGLLEGRDLIGQAPTGTGKTAAFALPLLQGLDLRSRQVQGLILTPTREIALQVTEAIQTFAKHLGPVSIISLVGGQSIVPQLQKLRRGAQIIVGTPGRVMDHLRRKTLQLDHLDKLVLDEADEMLRMGFIEDVEWILEHTPKQRQVMLFSATMPQEIAHVAKRHTREPIRIRLAQKDMTLPNIRQRYWMIQGLNKLDALTRILEAEPLDAAIIFARTRAGCAELAESLCARGHRAEALHGDMNQSAREQVMRRMKSGQLQLIVATDVAARGLDIEGLSHVINYDIPSDVEAYVHRIGRTGRAGRNGNAILFVSPRDRYMIRKIEHYTKQTIEPLKPPSYADVVAKRAEALKVRLLAVKDETLAPYLRVIEELAADGNDASQIAAAALHLAAGDKSLEIKKSGRFKEEGALGDKPYPKRRPAGGSTPYVKRSKGRPFRKADERPHRSMKNGENERPKRQGKRYVAGKKTTR